MTLKIHPDAFSSRLLVLAVFVTIPGCEKDNSKGGGAPKEATPESKLTLPEYYGFYAVDRGRTIELKNGLKTDVDFNPKVEFIIFQKKVALGLDANNETILRRLDIDSQINRVNLDWSNLNNWDRHLVQCRLKPVEGKAEMIRIVPVDDLAPGFYALKGSPVFFSVEFNKYVQGLATAARQAFAAKRWEEATKHAKTLLAINSGSSDMRDLLKNISYEKFMEDANRAFQSRDFDGAIGATGEALKNKPGAKEAMDLSEKAWNVIRQDMDYFGKFYIQLHTLQGHLNEVEALAFSPNGQVLVSGSKDGTIMVWDTKQWILQKTLKGHSGGVCAVAFSPDSKMLASGGWDDLIRIWDLQAGSELRTLSGHEKFNGSHVSCVAFSPDGSLLVSGSADRSIRFWNPGSGVQTRVIRGHGSGDPTNLRNVFSKEKPYTGGHGGRITGLVFSADGKVLTACSWDDFTVKLWDVEKGAELRTFNAGGNPEGLALSPDGKWLALGDYHGTLMFCEEAGMGKKVYKFNLRGFRFRSLIYTRSGERLLLGAGFSGDGGVIYIVDADHFDGKEHKYKELRGLSDQVNALSLSPDGKWLASGGGKTIIVWGVKGRG